MLQLQDRTTTVYRLVKDALREQNHEDIVAVAAKSDGTAYVFVCIATNHKGEDIVRRGRIWDYGVSLGGGNYYVDPRDARDLMAAEMLAD